MLLEIENHILRNYTKRLEEELKEIAYEKMIEFNYKGVINIIRQFNPRKIEAKHIVIIKKKLKRNLTQYEKVIFKDNNNLNFEIDNLLLIDIRGKIRYCPKCKKIKYLVRSKQHKLCKCNNPIKKQLICSQCKTIRFISPSTLKRRKTNLCKNCIIKNHLIKIKYIKIICLKCKKFRVLNYKIWRRKKSKYCKTCCQITTKILVQCHNCKKIRNLKRNRFLKLKTNYCRGCYAKLAKISRTS